jgi:alkylation response protein AidB-like acyl-CoA dehydrogenase
MSGPLDFELGEERELLRDEVRRFAEEQIRPGVAQRDADKEFPRAALAGLAEMGILGMLVPERYGGAELDVLAYAVVIAELARVCPATAVTVSVTSSVCCWPLATFGSESLKQRYLPKLASGEWIGGFGLTEPGAGSDAGGLRTTARRDGDSWVLDGEKAWITNAGEAGVFVVVARTGPADSGAKGLSAFVVPAETPGLSVGVPEHKMGLRASRTAPLVFEGCRVPADHLLANEGDGFRIAMKTLDHSRVGIAAQAIGIHQRALELAVSYAKERVQFGRPIGDQQAIRFHLAEMATELEAARLLTYHAAAADHTPDAGRLAAQAKLYASEAANRACFTSLQIHGGNGFCEDYEISRLYRDVRVTTIYEGTSEMQRLVIARRLLGGKV